MTEDRNTRHLLKPRPYPAELSLVIPMYNEEAGVELLRQEIERFGAELHCRLEVVLVNDGSTDGTLDRIAEWSYDDSRIKVVHLSRNFGHQLAATAGLDYATGDAVVLIDADLQDPLEVVHAMIERYCEGYDVAYGRRVSRAGETAFKRVTAWAFYRIMRSMVYKSLPVDTGDFRLMSRECLEGLQEMRETHRFLRGMVAWAGFPQVAVPYERRERAAGTTKYPLRKMAAFAWTAATSFSALPLKVSILIGIVVGLFGLEEMVRALLAHFLGWYTVPGWVSLTIVTSLIGSSLLISLGILGEYVGKIYEQAKERPLYLVARTFNVTGQARGSAVRAKQTQDSQ
jgi:polyisoprenyl-phosphate glycosyltransferase